MDKFEKIAEEVFMDHVLDRLTKQMFLKMLKEAAEKGYNLGYGAAS